MSYEVACGAVVFTRTDGEVRYLIIHQTNGVYGFPKGHVEGEETELETARREIREEVGLAPRFLDGFRTVDEYPLPGKPGVIKRVVFFLAEYGDEEIVVQEEEVSHTAALPFDQAMERLSFDSSRQVLREANDFLTHILDKE